jgi:hypothetical protein
MEESRMRAPTAGTWKTLGMVMLGGGALMFTYWTLYLTGVFDLGQSDPVVAAFESAFLLADTLLGLLLLAAGGSLLGHRSSGPYLMTVAASMSVYLGLLDLVFYTRRGLFSTASAADAFELSLISVCILGGGSCLRYGWKLIGSAVP